MLVLEEAFYMNCGHHCRVLYDVGAQYRHSNNRESNVIMVLELPTPQFRIFPAQIIELLGKHDIGIQIQSMRQLKLESRKDF